MINRKLSEVVHLKTYLLLNPCALKIIQVILALLLCTWIYWEYVRVQRVQVCCSWECRNLVHYSEKGKHSGRLWWMSLVARRLLHELFWVVFMCTIEQVSLRFIIVRERVWVWWKLSDILDTKSFPVFVCLSMKFRPQDTFPIIPVQYEIFFFLVLIFVMVTTAFSAPAECSPTLRFPIKQIYPLSLNSVSLRCSGPSERMRLD